MSPFPSDYYTVSDPTTSTGRRAYFPVGSFPPSTSGTAFDPTSWESNDGFSPGSTILIHVPSLDLATSHIATISDMGASLAHDSPVVLLDATTGKRWPTWAELDVSDSNPATRLLLIHPARNLKEGDCYLVALRDLKTSDGLSIPPPRSDSRLSFIPPRRHPVCTPTMRHTCATSSGNSVAMASDLPA
jgi:hypothetical protein